MADVRAEELPLPAARPVSTAKPLSARITDAVSAKLPKYVSLPPPPAGAADFPGTADEILYLPNITVSTGRMPPDATPFDFLTPKGRLELAVKSNPGLRLVPLGRLNNAVAVEIQTEEREAAKRAALQEQVMRVAWGDAAKTKEEIRQMRAATARPNTDWQGRSPGRE